MSAVIISVFSLSNKSVTGDLLKKTVIVDPSVFQTLMVLSKLAEIIKSPSKVQETPVTLSEWPRHKTFLLFLSHILTFVSQLPETTSSSLGETAKQTTAEVCPIRTEYKE